MVNPGVEGRLPTATAAAAAATAMEELPELGVKMVKLLDRRCEA